MHIHIITLPEERLRRFHLISRFAQLWADQGHLVTSGPVRKLEADIGIVHVDRTRVPSAALPINPLSRPLLNCNVLDISKRLYCKTLLESDSAYEGPVIVKTNENHFGDQEMAGKSPIKKFRRQLTRVLPWQLLREIPYKTYPVLGSKSDVPAWVWRRSDFIVDRFLPERAGDEFILRIWIFFGDQEYGVKIYSRDPVVKVGGMTHYEYTESVPEELRTVRSELNMDFGKFDYAIIDGQTILYDVNKTPSLARSSTTSPKIRQLSEGLDWYMKVGK
jgi:hypothetical protein